jgi:hypothetical protein
MRVGRQRDALKMNLDRVEPAQKMKKTILEKNGLWITILADSSASINWVRFQGYYLSSRFEEHPPGLFKCKRFNIIPKEWNNQLLQS